MKLGLIGGGYWGKNLIRTFNELESLHTICEIDDKLLEQYRVQYPHINLTKSYDEMLDNVDMVCVSVPAHLHYKFAKQALNAGKHVFVEKPITLDTMEAKELCSIAHNNNLTLMVGHLLHYHNAIIQIKEIVNSKKYGDIKYIVSNRKSHGIYRDFENVLWSFAPHDISIVLSLCNGTFNDVCNTHCTGTGYVNKDVEDIVNLSFNINDIYVNINVEWNSPFKEQKLTIAMENGLILFDDVNKELKVIENHVIDGKPNKENIINLNFEGDSPLYNECKHFIDCCNTGNKPITDGYEGVEVLKVLMHSNYSLKNMFFELQNFTKTMNTVQTSPSYSVHPSSACDSDNIGDGTKIWHFCNVTKDAIIGEKCNIGQNCYIAGTLGNNCKVQNNVSIYKGVKAGNNVFFGPSCVLTNDINPRCEYSKNGTYMETILEDGVTLGANCTIVCGHTIGRYSLIGAGAVVTKDVEPYSIMVGNPAKKIGTIDEQGNRTIIYTF